MPNQTHSRMVLPPGTKASSVLAILHNHGKVFTINDYVKTYQLLDPSSPLRGNAPSDVPVYEIVEDIPYLPYGLWMGTVRYIVQMHNLPDGLHTIVRAPAGVATNNTWKIVAGDENEHAGATEGSKDDKLVLEQTSKIECNRLYTLYVKSTLTTSHESFHRKLIQSLYESHET
ncbi:MAG: hypothetical protein M1834_007789 [Cirrosporium novae-zelandiae]|nr:MAG: hypothetical protein M1834_007789 [Cirrosporium novae-zelandiae]